jgi:hypothetical protein
LKRLIALQLRRKSEDSEDSEIRKARNHSVSEVWLLAVRIFRCPKEAQIFSFIDCVEGEIYKLIHLF